MQETMLYMNNKQKKQLTFSTYANEEERLKNKPKRKQIINMQLEVEMERYKHKIEGKFNNSTVNKGYVFPLKPDTSRENSPFQKKGGKSYSYSPDVVDSNVFTFSENKKQLESSNFEFGANSSVMKSNKANPQYSRGTHGQATGV